MPLKEKVAIVTGGSSGMGLGCALAFARNGAKVAVVSINKEENDKAVEAINNQGGQTIGCVTDVSKANQVQEMVEEVAKQFGGIDFLVNSAGIQRYGTAEETDEQLWDEVLNTNLKSMFLTAKYTIPHMRKRGGGSIVNVSSVQAFVTQQRVVAYTASKGGINALTRALAVDHAHENIRANAVCPASVDTPMLRWAADIFKEENETVEMVVNKWGKMHPIGRVATVEEIAEFVVYLCGPHAGFITGATYNLDGGILASSPVLLPED